MVKIADIFRRARDTRVRILKATPSLTPRPATRTGSPLFGDKLPDPANSELVSGATQAQSGSV